MRRIAAEEARKIVQEEIYMLEARLAEELEMTPPSAPRSVKAATPAHDTNFGPGDYLVHVSYGKVTARCRVLEGGVFYYFGERYTSATLAAQAAAAKIGQKSKTFNKRYWKKVGRAEWERAKGMG